MKFKIEPDIFKKFPGLIIGIVIARQIDNHDKSNEIMSFIREKEEDIRHHYDTETLSRHPKIQSWREAYSSFGAKPKKNKSSVESLYRMIMKGMNLRDINKMVNIYNYISIKHIVPVGGDDLDRVDGDIQLKFASGDESFIPLNSQETEAAKEGEVVYMDSKEVLCRKWNWRECDKTKMTVDTKNVVLVVEGLPPVIKEEMQRIIEELSGLVRSFCGGEIKTFILDEANREIEIKKSKD